MLGGSTTTEHQNSLYIAHVVVGAVVVVVGVVVVGVVVVSGVVVVVPPLAPAPIQIVTWAFLSVILPAKGHW